MQELDAFELMS